MNKKIIATVLLVLSLFFSLSTKAFADFDQIFMTDAPGSTTQVTVFEWDTTPWLYLRLPDTGFNVVGAWWQDCNANSFFVGSSPNINRDVWLSLDGGQDVNGNPVSWNDVRRRGWWNVDAIYFYANNPDNPFGSGSISFRVVPEPISAALFLLGSGALVVARKIRNRKKANNSNRII